MFKDKLNIFKSNGENDNKKRKMENIVLFIIILIITVLAINNMWSSDDNKTKIQDNNIVSDKTLAKIEENQTSDDLEKKLEDILSSIEGVGDVKVLIKYSESSTVVAMYNETTSESTTQENDGGGGNKNISESENKKEIVYTDVNGESKPITEKVVMPTIVGAIITAQGAKNANTKSSIVSAVEAVTGLAVHKIQVFEMVE